MTISNNQIEQLGKRLRDSEVTQADLTLLDKFRETHAEIDKQAYEIIKNQLDSKPYVTLTKRKRKTQQSIVDKLRRQKNLRLPQMQDIAGCRIVIQGGIEQALAINTLLTQAFVQPQWHIQSKDRHAHGYRAIHIIAKQNKQFYEIQLRTYAQDIWANLVERLSDKNNTLKYGGSEQEQVLINKLKTLAEYFVEIDQKAHQISFSNYHQQIEEAITNVLSH